MMLTNRIENNNVPKRHPSRNSIEDLTIGRKKNVIRRIVDKQSITMSLIFSRFVIVCCCCLYGCYNTIYFVEASTRQQQQQRKVLSKAFHNSRQRQQQQQQQQQQTSTSVSFTSGIIKLIQQRWNKATNMAKLEQYIDDWNANYIAINGNGESMSAIGSKYRRLIVLPLDDNLFNPPMGVFSHNHIQTGDKICLPSNFWPSIQLNKAEVPWLFSIKRIEGITSPRVQLIKKLSTSSTNKNTRTVTKRTTTDDDETIDNSKKDDDDNDNTNDEVEEPILISEYKSLLELDTVVGGPLDFRSPSCYIFLPYWMIRSLGLHPRDIVDVELITTVPAGSNAKLRPHSSNFSKDITNPQAVLETELRHYSSLTVGSTIAFDYNNNRYWFDIVECRSSPRGVKQSFAIKVQDCDIATDFLQAKDTLKPKKKKKKKKNNNKTNEERELNDRNKK